jgi:hypothetical protein
MTERATGTRGKAEQKMGKKAAEPLSITNTEELEDYLHNNHAAYMRHGNKVYYLTDVGENYWRAQDTSIRNHKNHFVDCSEIVPTMGEFMSLRFLDGLTIGEAFDHSTFYASISGEKDE